MPARKRNVGAKAPETKGPESVEKAERVARSVAKRAFELAERVADGVDEAAERVISTAEDLSGVEGKSARKFVRTLSEARDRGLCQAKDRTSKWIGNVAELVGGIAK
ncbi:MAG: hypothetical protein HYY13_07090 [Nitrospirae bacterium]|nr:hypothetical protein [Nitrospirota bacterium]